MKVVLIDDDEYWLGDLAGRRPIKRRYLADLVDKLAATAQVIALDFDVRLPNPQSTDIPADYHDETLALIQAIKRAAGHEKRLVLATPISYTAGGYRRDSDIYQAHGLCQAGETNKVKSNITCGYIALPRDRLVIPARLAMADGSYLDSFALALARAWDRDLTARVLDRIGDTVRYGSFIPEHAWDPARLFARKLRDGPVAEISKAVVVGAYWSRDAAGRGPRIDDRWTPVGNMVGAELHANFAEALLDGRVFRPTPEWLLRAVEVACSVFAAVAFALIATIRRKFVAIVGVLALLFLAQWAALHGFGIFFDIFVPLAGLALHALYERIFARSEHGTELQRKARS